MAIKTANDNSMSNITALPSGVSAKSMILLATETASSSDAISFTSNIDDTYDEYIFKFYDIHPATDDKELTVGFRDGSTAYDATKTTTGFTARHDEADTATSLEYTASDDLAQSTAAQHITGLIGNGNDESTSGELWLFNPSSTTYVKHFMARSNVYDRNNRSVDFFAAGYCNVTAAIDGVQFIMSSGNMDAGTIKLYGIKDS